MDVLIRLTAEHDATRALLEPVIAAAKARDPRALSASLEVAHTALTDGLDTHIEVEEEAFAAIAEKLGHEHLAQYYKDHVEIRALRDDVYRQLTQGTAPFEASLRLCNLILIHQQYEDHKLFPEAHESASQ
ncbi:MAG TPA: hemerythrin domain-containing protein [Ktedonobacterales bacterium]|nr:hemerythrin domain-containing protein [Ktedonobacterales bacterium]